MITHNSDVDLVAVVPSRVDVLVNNVVSDTDGGGLDIIVSDADGGVFCWVDVLVDIVVSDGGVDVLVDIVVSGGGVLRWVAPVDIVVSDGGGPVIHTCM
jgi:hypothetical protein